MVVNYKDGKLYKIISNHTDKIYIGSTTQPLCKRKVQHMTDYNRWKNGKGYKTSSFELIELGPVDIVLIESYPCDSKEQLHARERHFIEEYKDMCVNLYIPTRTDKERYEDNQEHISERKKQYYEHNKQKISEKITCECGSIVSKGHISRHLNTKKHQTFVSNSDDTEIGV